MMTAWSLMPRPSATDMPGGLAPSQPPLRAKSRAWPARSRATPQSRPACTATTPICGAADFAQLLRRRREWAQTRRAPTGKPATKRWRGGCKATPSMTTTTIRDYMTPAPHTIGVEQPLAVAAALMQAHHIRHLPVLHGGKLVGILSERDV